MNSKPSTHVAAARFVHISSNLMPKKGSPESDPLNFTRSVIRSVRARGAEEAQETEQVGRCNRAVTVEIAWAVVAACAVKRA